MPKITSQRREERVTDRNWSVFAYPGNKAKLADWILPHLADHRCYVEAFGGAAGLLANKPESKVEVYNDRDGDLVQFFETLRDSGDELVEWLSDTPYSREICEEWGTDWYDGWRPEDPIERAGVFFYLRQTSFGGKYRYNGGFATSTMRNQAMTYQNQIGRLEDFADRFRGQVVIENLDWREVIDRYDDEETLFYLDPPYDDVKPRYRYGDEFDHAELASALEDVEARWVVSCGIPPESIRGVGETVIERTTKYQMSAGRNGPGRERSETLVLGYDPRDVKLFANDQAELERFMTGRS